MYTQGDRLANAPDAVAGVRLLRSTAIRNRLVQGKRSRFADFFQVASARRLSKANASQFILFGQGFGMCGLMSTRSCQNIDLVEPQELVFQLVDWGY